jgi:dihydrofolate synthase/folylpolyglutamate synthase
MVYHKYLASLDKFGINFGLKRITHLLRKLDDPQRKFNSIHIAGTNGKGSTAAMIATILKEAGYKVGLYTSPHIVDYTERIKVRGNDISKRDLTAALAKVKRASRGMKSKPTIFEVLTAAAFLYFAEKKVDIAVVEVGMGGRLDATNVLTPLVSVITNIDLEHTEVLGKTIRKIAAEKAAIIKPGVPVVTAERKPAALNVMKKFAVKNGSLLVQVSSKERGVRGKLIGDHQKANRVCAIAAVRLAGIKASRKQIMNGLEKTEWPGRFQIISRKPLVIADGAHNPAGAKALRVTIEKLFPHKFTIIFGCQKTKDYKKILSELQPIAKRIIITSSSHKQAQDPRKIARWVRGKMTAHLAPSASAASLVWDGRSPLLVTGSIFLVADFLKISK